MAPKSRIPGFLLARENARRLQAGSWVDIAGLPGRSCRGFTDFFFCTSGCISVDAARRRALRLVCFIGFGVGIPAV